MKKFENTVKNTFEKLQNLWGKSPLYLHPLPPNVHKVWQIDFLLDHSPPSRATQCTEIWFQTPTLWSWKWRANWIWERYKHFLTIKTLVRFQLEMNGSNVSGKVIKRKSFSAVFAQVRFLAALNSSSWWLDV